MPVIYFLVSSATQHLAPTAMPARREVVYNQAAALNVTSTTNASSATCQRKLRRRSTRHKRQRTAKIRGHRKEKINKRLWQYGWVWLKSSHFCLSCQSYIHYIKLYSLKEWVEYFSPQCNVHTMYHFISKWHLWPRFDSYLIHRTDSQIQQNRKITFFCTPFSSILKVDGV